VGHLLEIGKLFGKLGLVAFGGPAAHIGMMEEEVVNKRKWMDSQHFLDMVGATNLIPGPNSTEMAMHCGYHRGGVAGLFVAGITFIVPATILTVILAMFYTAYGKVPAIEPFFYGIQAAVLCIILSAVIKLGNKAIKENHQIVLAFFVILFSVFGLSEVIAILGAGAIGLAFASFSQRANSKEGRKLLPLFIPAAAGTGITAITSVGLFWTFLKIGAILFGSGYVLIAYLDAELVERLGWLTKPELLDAVAMGQFTPGPVLSTASFIGYYLHGYKGALMATAGIFLPSFLFVWLLNPLIPKIRASKLAGAFLDAVNVGAVGVMVAVLLQFGRDIFTDWRTAVIAALTGILYFGFNLKNPILIVLIGAVSGYGLHLLTT
jgi:chromate transporter